MKQENDLYAILRGMIRQEIDRTPGFRELTLESDYPCNDHAERTVLGAVLLEGRIPAEVKGLLPDDFSLDSHRRIFLRMSELQDGGHAVDIVTLSEIIMRYKDAIAPTPVAYLASLTEGLPRRPVIGEYVAIVKEKAKLRRIWKACEAAIEKCKAQALGSGEIVSELGVDLKGLSRKAAK